MSLVGACLYCLLLLHVALLLFPSSWQADCTIRSSHWKVHLSVKIVCVLAECVQWLVQVIDDPSTDSLLLVMEHVDGGSLEQPYDAASKTWQTLPEALVHRHFRELCKVRTSKAFKLTAALRTLLSHCIANREVNTHSHQGGAPDMSVCKKHD